jgi:Protein of unknown function (DUF1439)
MQRIIIGAVVLLLLAGVAGYFLMRGEEFEIRLTQQEIQERLDQKFPLTKKYLFLVDVTYSNPRVTLVSGDDRVRLSLDAALGNLTPSNGDRIQGSSEVLAGVRYDAARYEFYLVDPVIGSLEINGLPESIAPKAQKALQVVIQEYLDHFPIYKLPPTDIKKVTARMILKRVRVDNGELVFTLGY